MYLELLFNHKWIESKPLELYFLLSLVLQRVESKSFVMNCLTIMTYRYSFMYDFFFKGISMYFYMMNDL